VDVEVRPIGAIYRPKTSKISKRRNSGDELAQRETNLATAAYSVGEPARWHGAAVWRALEEPAERKRRRR
jgi:hypothetical protein